MKQYDVEVLKEMIEINKRNIKMHQQYLNSYIEFGQLEQAEFTYNRIANLGIANRKMGALIENNGERIIGADVNSMQYSATAGADTSWWG
jgi:hypothetical protein